MDVHQWKGPVIVDYSFACRMWVIFAATRVSSWDYHCICWFWRYHFKENRASTAWRIVDNCKRISTVVPWPLLSISFSPDRSTTSFPGPSDATTSSIFVTKSLTLMSVYANPLMAYQEFVWNYSYLVINLYITKSIITVKLTNCTRRSLYQSHSLIPSYGVNLTSSFHFLFFFSIEGHNALVNEALFDNEISNDTYIFGLEFRMGKKFISMCENRYVKDEQYHFRLSFFLFWTN